MKKKKNSLEAMTPEKIHEKTPEKIEKKVKVAALPSWAYMVLPLFILVVAFVFRFWDIGLKPAHSDEGVNGFFVNQIIEHGFFKYDPNNYHGPLHFYLLWLSEKIFGFGIHSFRFVTCFFSFLSVVLVLSQRSLLGPLRYAVALALALSPGMIFFGRSAIHEAGFVFFQMLWIISWLNFRRTLLRRHFALLLVGLIGALTHKETFVITGAVFVIAFLSEFFYKKDREDLKLEWKKIWNFLRHDHLDFCLYGFLIALWSWYLLFTGFMKNPQGSLDFFRAFLPWLKTGTGATGHEKVWYYWFELLSKYEWLVLIGIGLSVLALLSKKRDLRFMAIYGLLTVLIYSLIPYKTPWCILSLIWPPLLVFAMYFNGRTRLLWGPLLGIAFLHSVVMAVQVNFVKYDTPEESYVYVQTKRDYHWLARVLKDVNRVDVHVDDIWPLPWFLSRHKDVRYGFADAPLAPEADVTIIDADRLEEKLKDLKTPLWYRQIDFRDSRQAIVVLVTEPWYEQLTDADRSVLTKR